MDADVLAILFGAGGIAGVLTAAFTGWQAIRKGTREREREAVADIAKWREEADDARRTAELELGFYRRWTGTLEYTLAQHGIQLPERPPFPTNGGKQK